ncbi:MAG: lasso RiPP family leader peptide-containing protein [Deltaproteobacteria bacterium]|nr:lasso RiPP family leader peptide-containing protein [Deltaproteobacteria bacterium]
MKRPNETTRQDGTLPRPAGERADDVRLPYATPQLTEHGTFEELTQGAPPFGGGDPFASG